MSNTEAKMTETTTRDEILAKIPHPDRRFARRGYTFLDYVEFCSKKCSAAWVGRKIDAAIAEYEAAAREQAEVDAKAAARKAREDREREIAANPTWIDWSAKVVVSTSQRAYHDETMYRVPLKRPIVTAEDRRALDEEVRILTTVRPWLGCCWTGNVESVGKDGTVVVRFCWPIGD